MTPSNAPAPVAPTIDVDALTAAPVRRTPTYRVAENAPAHEFGDSLLSRGTHGKSGAASLVLTNGTQQTGFPIAAVSVAIMEGLISRDEIGALWSAADARTATLKAA